LEVGGPTFVKLGQWLATRKDMFSEAACEALSRLHTNVKASFDPELKADAILDAEKATGAVIDTSRSIGQGCLGQVYMAQLEDGRKAVAKVLRPSIEQWLQDDVEILRFMAHRILDCFPSMKELAIGEAVDIFGYWMNMQADLTVEAQQLERFRNNFVDHATICCPKVYYASRDVLVMDYVEGKSLSELLQENPREEFIEQNADAIHQTLGRMMGHMLIQDNFVHQDLHPGNLILERTDEKDWLRRPASLLPYMPRWLRSTLEVNFAPPNPFKIHVIDAGLAVQMQPEESSFFKSMIISCFTKHDPISAGETAYQLHQRHGRTSSHTVREDFVRDIGNLLLMSCVELPESAWSSYFPDEASYMHAGLTEYLDKFINQFRTHGVRMEPSIWSILCSFALLEGTMRQLKLGVNGLDSVLPYVFDLRANFHAWARDRRLAVTYALYGEGALHALR
jgi:predicted unusual protein kinase regulating ubiquinone biosynthesis (AarF/ABC1/UbiB family)